MMWLALPLTAWACVAAYGIWAWRSDRRAARNEKREEQMRLNASFDSIQKLILQWSKIREAAETPAQPPFPTEGDNFQTLRPDNLVEFGKRPRTTDTQPDGAA